LNVLGLSRSDGAIRFQRSAGSAPGSCIVVDDFALVNTGAGELVALGAHDGAVRFQHVFGGADVERPRRLEPVLRSGALFVPQQGVHVVRPRDGTLIGHIPTDLVPDVVRVDEHCNVFAFEESGHVAAYGSGPRLSLVT
jgi:hypothetical protein